jgi:hypothetical protein
MQIDFHHTVTYIVARLAGFKKVDATIIAHSAQYVDDATNSGEIKFQNKAMYNRISSAHKMLDYRNADELANHRVWIPFHFLPSNEGLKAGQNPDANFVDKIVCKPDSFVAKDMIEYCINDIDKDYGLHRLGVTMHVYADTWAHQNFAGINDDINRATKLVATKINGKKNNDARIKWEDKMKNFFGKLFDEAKGDLVGDLFPLGHGSVLSYPDKPYLKWEYIKNDGTKYKRKNADEFMKAVESMFEVINKYRIQFYSNINSGIKSNILQQSDKDKIYNNMINFDSSDEEERHQAWINSIANGDFSFGSEKVEYVAKGRKSWKYEAIGERREIDLKDTEYPYSKDFLSSNWKLFHDAIQAHRFDVIHDILPKYGICVA